MRRCVGACVPVLGLLFVGIGFPPRAPARDLCWEGETFFGSLLCQRYLIWVSLLFEQALKPCPPVRCARKKRPCLGLFYVKGTFRVSLFWWPPPAGAAAHPGSRRTYARTDGTHARRPHDLFLSHFSTYRQLAYGTTWSTLRFS